MINSTDKSLKILSRNGLKFFTIAVFSILLGQTPSMASVKIMPLEIKKIDHSINKSNYDEKRVNEFEPQFVNEVKNIEEIKEIEGKTLNEKVNSFRGFVFYALTPVYEIYIEQKINREKGVDIMKETINPDDKSIFPDGIKSGLKYFNEFIKAYKQGNLNLSTARDFDKYMQIFYKLPDKSKVAIFKEVYYSTYYFDAFNRHMRCTVHLLEKLKDN